MKDSNLYCNSSTLNISNPSKQQSLIFYLNQSFKTYSHKIFVSSITNEFRIKLLNSILPNISNSFFHSSFNNNKFKTLLTNIRTKKFIITEADKSIGLVIFKSDLYDSLALDHLNNKNVYKIIDSNPQIHLYRSCNEIIQNLFSNNHISKSLFNLFTKNIKNKKLAKFRFLPKLHKEKKFGIRPIINCKDSTLEVIAKSLDFFLKPVANKHFTFLKDSQNLIQLTQDIILNNNTFLYSADFESLYTNIPINEALTIISDMFSNTNSTDIDGYGFHCLLKLVLFNNYFYYRSSKNMIFFYLQILGIAMGIICGPNIANLYLAYFEIRYLSLINTVLYFRYIDDIFVASHFKLSTIDFQSVYPNLSLNLISNKNVTFLDLNISINIHKQLEFDLYIKPTNTFSYLCSISNHPTYIFKNIIKSLLIRIRRNCSN